MTVSQKYHLMESKKTDGVAERNRGVNTEKKRKTILRMFYPEKTIPCAHTAKTAI